MDPPASTTAAPEQSWLVNVSPDDRSPPRSSSRDDIQHQGAHFLNPPSPRHTALAPPQLQLRSTSVNSRRTASSKNSHPTGDHKDHPDKASITSANERDVRNESAVESIIEKEREILDKEKEILEDLTRIDDADIDYSAQTDSTPQVALKKSWRLGTLKQTMDGKNAFGKVLNYFFLTVLLISIVSLCLETLPMIVAHEEAQFAFFIADTTSIAFFTIELALRLVTIETWKDIFTFYTMIDVVSVLPYYIEVGVTESSHGDAVKGVTAVNGASGLRAMRLFRTFRLLKFIKSHGRLAIVLEALKQSGHGILMLLMTMSVMIIFFSSLLFYAEQPYEWFDNNRKQWLYYDNTISPYQSIPSCFYPVVGALSGSIPSVPKSPYGQLVIGIAMVSSVFLIAFPLTIINISYSKTVREYTKRQKAILAEKLRKEVEMREAEQQRLLEVERALHEEEYQKLSVIRETTLEGGAVDPGVAEISAGTLVGTSEPPMLRRYVTQVMDATQTNEKKSSISLHREKSLTGIYNVVSALSPNETKELELRIVDWSFVAAQRQRIRRKSKSERVSRKFGAGEDGSDSSESDSDEENINMDEVPDKLVLRLTVRDGEQFRRVMQALADVS